MSKRALCILLPAAVILVLLSGCWPLQQDSGSSTSGTPGATAAAPTITPLPQSADTLNIGGQATDPPTLDPALATDPYSLFVVRQLFSGLLAFDDNLNVVPDIASALPVVSADGRTYTFALRQGVKFPDGQEVTSADFKYSLERAADPKLAGAEPVAQLPAGLYLSDIVGVSDKLAGKAGDISGVTAPDPYTLKITITAPEAYFLSKLASGPTFVVEKSNVEEGGAWTEHPRGTGPFRLEKWTHNEQLALARNPDYYAGAPAPAHVNIWMGAAAGGGLAQYEAGGLDVTAVPVDDISRIADRNNPISAELQSVPDLSVTYLGFNLRQKPFDDPKVREALTLVIDRGNIASVLFQSRVRQAYGFVPPNMAGYTPLSQEDTLDVTRARQLLSESTYKAAANLPPLKLYTAGDSLGPLLQGVFSSTLGIQVAVQEVEWSDYLEGLGNHEYPMFTLTWNAGYPDPEAILGSLFRSSSPDNQTGYRNADVDAALDIADKEPNQQKRMTTYAQVESRILADYPAVPLYHSVTYTLVKPYVQGLKVTPLGILSLKNVVLKRTRKT